MLQPEPLRFAVRAATHYHTRAWQTFIYGKECFILLLCLLLEFILMLIIYYEVAITWADPEGTDSWPGPDPL